MNIIKRIVILLFFSFSTIGYANNQYEDVLVLGDSGYIKKAEKILGIKISRNLVRGEYSSQNKKYWFLQIIEVREGGKADLAGIKKGEFLAGVNGLKIYKTKGVFKKATKKFIEGGIAGEIKLVLAIPKKYSKDDFWYNEKSIRLDGKQVPTAIESALSNVKKVQPSNLLGTRYSEIFTDAEIECMMYIIFDSSIPQNRKLKYMNTLYEDYTDKVEDCDKSELKSIVIRELDKNNNIIGTFGLVRAPYGTSRLYTLDESTDVNLLFKLITTQDAFLYHLLANDIKTMESASGYKYTIGHLYYFFAKEYGRICKNIIPVNSRTILIESVIQAESRGGFTYETNRDNYEYTIEKDFADRTKAYSTSLAFGLSSAETSEHVSWAINKYGCKSKKIALLRDRLLKFGNHFDGVKYDMPVNW